MAKTFDHTFDDPVMKLLGKFDIFIVTVLVVTVISYYQIKELFDTEYQLTIYMALVTGLIFAGLLSLTLREWTKPRRKEKRQ
jgi:FtsH-binding integral membrane protein